jgi:hypothetical protein
MGPGVEDFEQYIMETPLRGAIPWLFSMRPGYTGRGTQELELRGLPAHVLSSLDILGRWGSVSYFRPLLSAPSTGMAV